MIPCVILAGGLGTRIQAVSGPIPKALVPVAGKPFAHHQLTWLGSQNVSSVVYCVGHRGDALRSYVKSGRRWGVSVSYVDEGPTLKGTAGALRLAMDHGALPEEFLVLYGDSYLPTMLAPVVDDFVQSPLPALMTVFRNDGLYENSNARYEDGRIVLYEKSHPDPAGAGLHFVDYGLSILRRAVIAEIVGPGESYDLADVFHRLSVEGRLAGHQVDERFYEVGSPAGLRALEDYFTRLGQ